MKTVSKDVMQSIYQKIKTPYKYGAVIKDDEFWADCPTVFKYNDKWYMYYIMVNSDPTNSGYETHYASSDNLKDWKYEGKIFERTEGDNWDSRQVSGYVAFPDIQFGGTNELNKVNGKYYMSYMGGNLNGYETDPLSMGLAFSDSPIGKFTKFEKPIFTPSDPDARELETSTLYKSYMFEDEAMMTGHRYVNAYNAKAQDLRERIFLAVSDDGENWQRYLDHPVIDEINTSPELPGMLISGDPQIVKIDDVYVMFYFRSQIDNGAYNNFACSYNLTDWTIWDGEPLIKCEFEWENVYAHKGYVIKHDDVIYHFYCAVNDKDERFIALAASKKLGE